MASNYWTHRLNRRKVLVGGSAGLGLAGLALMGCGSGNGGSKTPQEASSLLTKFEDTSRTAKKGGIFSSFVNGDENIFDPLITPRGTGLGGPTRFAYMRLFREKEAAGGTPKAEFLGDAAEKWELTDGGTKLIVHLRQDVKYDARAPTNGRLMDADDVVFSWNRMITQSPYASELYNGTDPAAPVESMTKIDSKTVSFKMAFPWVPLLAKMASGVFVMAPREGEKEIDLRNTIRGSGPWILDKYEPSARFEWRRNPNYFRKEWPFLDGFNTPIITETAGQLGAFRSKQIDHVQPPVTDILTIAQTPGVKLYQKRLGPNLRQIMFGSRPDSIFRDVRIRRAMSFAMDRDLMSEVATEATMFRKAGIDYEINLDSHMTAAYKDQGLWLDPTGKDLGEGAKYFKYDVAEAKKLLSAAGYANGLDQTVSQQMLFHYSNRGSDPQKEAEKTAAMLAEAGIRFKLQSADYQTVWLPIIYVSPSNNKGNFDGIGLGGSTIALPDPIAYMYFRIHGTGGSSGARNFGDPETQKTDDTIAKALREFDDDKRKALVHDVQRQMALTQACVSYGCGYRRHELAWQWVKNWGFEPSWDGNANSGDLYHQVWLDEAQRIA